MNKPNLVLMAALAAVGLAGVTAGSLLPVSAALAAKEKPAKAAEGPKLSPAVGKPLVAAQAAMQAKNWDEAYTQLQAAMAIEPKQPYDAYVIDELGWFVMLQRKDYAKSAEMLERAVTSEFMTAADKPQRLRALTQLHLQNKNYAKAIQFGTDYLKVNPADTDIALGVAQARYLSDDFPGAKAAAEQLVASSAKPAEPALLLALRSNYELKDNAGTVRALEGLVRYYPQPKYWEDLLNTQLFRTKDDRGLRGLYRLMDETGTLDKGDEFSEMGSMLIAGGFPTEAKQVLERGMAKNALQGDGRTRAQADLDRARTQAAADEKELATAPAQVTAAKTGNQVVAIGKLYFSAGQYGNAADTIQKGIAKGGVTDLDDANLLLGIANVRAGKAAEAVAAFDAVKNPALAEIARLWKIKVESAAAATAAPAPAAATG